MDYKNQYNILKEKIVDKYNYWCLRHILIDIEDVGCVDYLIGDDDEFLYNVELGRELKEIIDDILENNYDTELLVDFLDLKKITDGRIINNPFYDEIYVNEYIFEVKTTNSNNKPIIKLNPNIKDKNKTLSNIFNFLKKEGYVTCSKKDFISHFEPSKNWDLKIHWTGNLSSLICLVENLFIKNVFPKYQRRKLKIKTILNHFKNDNGDLKQGSIKTLASDEYKIKSHKEINNFISLLKVDFD